MEMWIDFALSYPDPKKRFGEKRCFCRSPSWFLLTSQKSTKIKGRTNMFKCNSDCALN